MIWWGKDPSPKFVLQGSARGTDLPQTLWCYRDMKGGMDFSQKLCYRVLKGEDPPPKAVLQGSERGKALPQKTKKNIYKTSEIFYSPDSCEVKVALYTTIERDRQTDIYNIFLLSSVCQFASLYAIKTSYNSV